ncbi:MAG: HAMP domain-containing histidine kinase [Brevinematales bacterium]|nr:HAMP domain-containing histidine kinase [Brevinematales bacterium]
MPRKNPLLDFAFRELQLKDKLLEVLIRVQSCHPEESEDILLRIFLEAFLSLFGFERAVYFRFEKGKGLQWALSLNIEPAEKEKPYFSHMMSDIVEASVSLRWMQQRVPVIKDEKEVFLTFLVLPVAREKTLYGVFYVDIENHSESLDIDLIHILVVQASLSLYYRQMYEVTRSQQIELLKLANFKNEIVRQITANIEGPLEKTLHFMETIKMDVPESCASHFGEIHKRLSQIFLTLEKTLNLGKIGANIEDIFQKDVDIRLMIDRILKNYEKEIKKRHLEVEVRIHDRFPLLKGNEDIFRTIFDELISNAIYYNREKGRIVLYAYQDSRGYVIEIRDTGRGIPLEFQPLIFEQFYRLPGSEKLNDKGAGLGLFLVRKFLAYYGATVSVESIEGEGSVFTVVFPL